MHANGSGGDASCCDRRELEVADPGDNPVTCLRKAVLVSDGLNVGQGLPVRLRERGLSGGAH